MSNIDYLNLSTDLRRISVWLVTGRVSLAEQFLAKIMVNFGKEETVFGKKTLRIWLERIVNHAQYGWKSAEDALTLSILLKNRFTTNGLEA